MDKVFRNTDEVIMERRDALISALSSNYVPESFEYTPSNMPKYKLGDEIEDDSVEKFTQAFKDFIEATEKKQAETTHPILDAFGVGQLAADQSNGYNWMNENLNDYQEHKSQGDRLFSGINILDQNISQENIQKMQDFIKENNLQSGQWMTKQQQDELMNKLGTQFGNVAEVKFIGDNEYKKMSNQALREYMGRSIHDALPNFRLPEAPQKRLPDTNVYLNQNLGDYNYAPNLPTDPIFRYENMNNRIIS